MPAMAKTVTFYLPPFLAARASICFYYLTFHPELTPPIEDPRVVVVIIV